MIGYKNTISGGSSIMQPIRIPENTRNVILINLIQFNSNIQRNYVFHPLPIKPKYELKVASRVFTSTRHPIILALSMIECKFHIE